MAALSRDNVTADARLAYGKTVKTLLPFDKADRFYGGVSHWAFTADASVAHLTPYREGVGRTECHGPIGVTLFQGQNAVAILKGQRQAAWDSRLTIRELAN